MPSPFPGMNPYFEQAAYWLDFHTEFLTALRRLLAPQVAPKYIVQLEEHIYVHDLPSESRQRLGTADLSVVEPGRSELAQAALGSSRSTGGSLASRAGRGESPLPGSARPTGPGAGHRDRALEPVEQASRRRPRAVPGQASGTAAQPCAPRRDRPTARLDSHAPGRRARVRLLSAGQPGREAAGRRFLAHPSPRPAAGDPAPAPSSGCRCPGRSSGSASPRLMTGPATSTSSTAANPNRACRRAMRPGHDSSCRQEPEPEPAAGSRRPATRVGCPFAAA